jgi:exoribonuclease R
MTTLTFDTLKFANRLKAAGVPDKQAEAEAEALAEALGDSIKASDLANKNDLHDSEIRIIKWVVAMAIAQIAFIVGLIIRLPH